MTQDVSMYGAPRVVTLAGKPYEGAEPSRPLPSPAAPEMVSGRGILDVLYAVALAPDPLPGAVASARTDLERVDNEFTLGLALFLFEHD